MDKERTDNFTLLFGDVSDDSGEEGSLSTVALSSSSAENASTKKCPSRCNVLDYLKSDTGSIPLTHIAANRPKSVFFQSDENGEGINAQISKDIKEKGIALTTSTRHSVLPQQLPQPRVVLQTFDAIQMQNTDGVIDADIAYENIANREAKMLLADGISIEDIAIIKLKKKYADDVYLCRQMIKCSIWEKDDSCTAKSVYITYAAALDGLSRQDEAIACLKSAINEFPQYNSAFTISLAKILFRANKKQEALKMCQFVCDAFLRWKAKPDGNFVSLKDAAEAYDGDNHTAAYNAWTNGHKAITSCPRLKRQAKKRDCWDSFVGADCSNVYTGSHLIGQGAHGNGVFDVECDLDSFEVHSSHFNQTPALSLFNKSAQGKRVVFRSKSSLLTKEECDNVLEEVNQYIKVEKNDKWPTVRQSSVKTTDIAVEDIPKLSSWLLELLHSRLYPMVAAAFPILADGTSPSNRLRVHDAFIVRYDECDKSMSLPEHCDTSSMSFTVSLNSDFEGGGTWFEALGPDGKVIKAEIGQAVLFAGPLRHAGFPITKGTRIILVLFLYVENFEYGKYIQEYCKTYKCGSSGGAQINEKEKKNRIHAVQKSLNNNPLTKLQGIENSDDNLEATESKCKDTIEQCIKPSGDQPGGFVVYRQTMELASMLQVDAGTQWND